MLTQWQIHLGEIKLTSHLIIKILLNYTVTGINVCVVVCVSLQLQPQTVDGSLCSFLQC